MTNKKLEIRVTRAFEESFSAYKEKFHKDEKVMRGKMLNEAFRFIIANKINIGSVMKYVPKYTELEEMPSHIHLYVDPELYDAANQYVKDNSPKTMICMSHTCRMAMNARLYYAELEDNKSEFIATVNAKNENYDYALAKGIKVDVGIYEKDHVRGVYGIFVDNECYFVGSADSMYDKIFLNDCHIARIKHNCHGNALMSAINRERKVEFRVLEVVPYNQKGNPILETQKLKSRENYWKDYYLSGGHPYLMPDI